MSRILSLAGALVDTIKINAVTRERRDGRTLWIKRRRWTAAPLMACANHFFRLARNPIQAIDDTPAWQTWEVNWFLRLHGEDFSAFADGARAVAVEELPGQSLSQHLEAGTWTLPMLTAAALELRRAHAMDCPRLGALWSHGDPHAGNFVYDAASDRARLIDFEVMHHPGMPVAERQADDLLIFLQDLVGRISAERWLPCARAFVADYGESEITERLREKLVVPPGWARIWWAVRTTYLAPQELIARIGALRAAL